MMPSQFQAMPQVYAAPPPAQWAQQQQPMYRAPAAQYPAPSPRISSAVPQQPAQPRITARGAMPDEAPARARIELPAPEAFGLKAAPDAGTSLVGNTLANQTIQITAVNWTMVREELHRLGAKSFHVEQVNDGRHRFACKVAKTTGQMDLVEVFGRTEEEAVRSGLERANALRYGS
jgi:hypothetical protein